MPYDDVYIDVSDGVRLHAWFIQQPRPAERPTVVFFHANAGNMGFRLPNLFQVGHSYVTAVKLAKAVHVTVSLVIASDELAHLAVGVLESEHLHCVIPRLRRKHRSLHARCNRLPCHEDF